MTVDRYVVSAKAWQIHDVLKTLSSALPVDHLDDAVPIHGVVGLLIDLSRQVADAVSDWPDSPTRVPGAGSHLNCPRVSTWNEDASNDCDCSRVSGNKDCLKERP
ncbi:hypothetical protein [Paraburkholderia caribensis]|uniref:hypothetical protein n=1 Tax=Paraburkholderia caribensis TaxID=75105 RepID=UPI001CABF98D|nr:hypothetical protein [Paraburkholderia caribensis]CAG9269361.1 2-dehydropantoate 2-reductase [Paraburkholderia caribensis]